MTDVLAVCSDLTVRRGTFRLNITNQRFVAGKVYGVVGPNGAGKSTWMRSLAGLLRPSGGTIRVFGLDPLAEPVSVRERFGFMADDMALYNVPVRNLMAAMVDYYPTWDADYAAHLCSRFEVPMDRRVGDLSKGLGVCVRLIGAMAFRPLLSIFDEPLTGLDTRRAEMWLELVRSDLVAEDRSVILASHRHHDMEPLLDELVVLDKGRIVASGPVDTLRGNAPTLTDALRGLLAESPPEPA